MTAAWKDVVTPTVRKCDLAAMLNMNVIFKPDAALTLATLLEQMAKIIDKEIAVRTAAEIATAVIEGRT